MPPIKISFEGKKVMVTGAARGLGKDLVAKLHSQGALVYAVSRNPENLAKLQKEYPKITTIVADLSNWDTAREALKPVAGQMDFLVNNAGVVHVQPFLNVTPECFDSQWNVNVKGVINVSQLVVEGMISRGQGGSIVNVSSLGGKVTSQSLGIYDTTKAALDMLTRNMARELGQYGIRVNSVNPSMFATDMTKDWLQRNPDGGAPFLQRTPLRRLVQSDEVVNTILFLLSDMSSMINAETILIDGGYAAN